MRTVAALFVDPKGAYAGLPGVKVWDEARDARTYPGPHPVVAHPPCHLWVNMAGVNFKRYGGPHNRPGNDGGCFAQALAAVRRWGGVLEHPAGSFAWATFYLRKPDPVGWSPCDSGWVCEVWQSAYGHKARKRTWLYFHGEREPADMDWSKPEGTHQIGWFDRKKPTLGKTAASATPEAFRDALIRLARQSRRDALGVL